MVSTTVEYLTEDIHPSDRAEAEHRWSRQRADRQRLDGVASRLPEPLAPAKWAFLGALGLMAAAVASGQA